MWTTISTKIYRLFTIDGGPMDYCITFFVSAYITAFTLLLFIIMRFVCPRFPLRDEMVQLFGSL